MNVCYLYVGKHPVSTVAHIVDGGCLNAHWFLSLADAQSKINDWRTY